MFEKQPATPLQKIKSTLLEEKEINLYIKRDDLIHPEISGNKWRKLKYNLMSARSKGYKTLLTFGGAYSNHIAATAAAANVYGFDAIGIIRGDELHKDSNKTLRKASDDGMKLIFISREKYRNKEKAEYIQSLQEEFGDFYHIPEGGSNPLALKGCTEVIQEIDIDFGCIVTAVGTGGTLAGLACGISQEQSVLGISVLKGAKYLNDKVEKLISSYSNESPKPWEINHEYHLGGYAKSNVALVQFMEEFNNSHGILLDPIYTGKMMMALFDLIKKDYFSPETVVIALHTGGLQGIP